MRLPPFGLGRRPRGSERGETAGHRCASLYGAPGGPRHLRDVGSVVGRPSHRGAPAPRRSRRHTSPTGGRPQSVRGRPGVGAVRASHHAGSEGLVEKSQVTTAWREYFDGLKDQSPLYRVQAALYVDSLREAVGLHHDQRVLDFGCGFGFVVALLAPLVTEVGWWDPSPNMRSAAERNTTRFPNARFCDLSAMSLTESRGSTWR